jgi:basic amino acid/polyamine antiporter, APA family
MGDAPPPARGEEAQLLSLPMCIALVMGNMIGSGVFLLPASLAPFGWNAVLAWGVTISGAMALAMVLARLTQAVPGATGPTGFVSAAFGGVAGFLIGWVYWVSIWTAVVTIAVAAISYLSSFAPALGTVPFLPALAAMALLWMATAINLRGARSAGQFQLVTLIIKLMPLVLVIIIAAALIFQGKAAPPPLPAEGFSFTQVNAAAAMTLWALLGFECASLAAAKTRNPAVTIPRATIIGAAATGLLYLFVCSAIALLLPPEIAINSPAPFAAFVEMFWSPTAGSFIALFAAISCIGALNGWVMMQGELPRTMAAQGLLPRWLEQADANGTPRQALIMSSVVASILLLMNSSKGMKPLFEFLLLLSTSATLWLYLACALAAIKLRVALPFAIFGAIYALYTLWGAGWTASGLSLALMAMGLPILWWTKRTQASTSPGSFRA